LIALDLAQIAERDACLTRHMLEREAPDPSQLANPAADLGLRIDRFEMLGRAPFLGGP